jgi:hypothetical protein
MLATLNSKQIVDEIVKDVMRDNDPHDVVQIAPEIVLASRTRHDAPTLAPNPELPKLVPAESAAAREPQFTDAYERSTVAPSVDSAMRATASDRLSPPKRSAIGKWLGGALMAFLLAAGSTAATVAWQVHGDSARAIISAWMPGSMVQAAQPVAAQTTPSETEGTVASNEQQAAATAARVDGAQDSTPASGAIESLKSVTQDVAAMTQQIEQLKASIAELRASQEQMAREMAKSAAAKAVEAKPVSPPPARVAAAQPHPPAVPPRKPKPVYTPAYAPGYAPLPIAPAQSQAAAVPPPPSAAPQIADDEGPVVRPPMPLR